MYILFEFGILIKIHVLVGGFPALISGMGNEINLKLITKRDSLANIV